MAATQSTKQLATKLGTLANSWVRDPFRPNIQMSTFLQSLARHPRLTPQVVQAIATLHRGDVKKAVRIVTLEAKNEADNSVQYPLSDKMLHPPSSPHYYDRLLEGFNKSQQGIARPWWKIFFNIW